jgi:hypothetical protein
MLTDNMTDNLTDQKLKITPVYRGPNDLTDHQRRMFWQRVSRFWICELSGALSIQCVHARDTCWSTIGQLADVIDGFFIKISQR